MKPKVYGPGLPDLKKVIKALGYVKKTTKKPKKTVTKKTVSKKKATKKSAAKKKVKKPAKKQVSRKRAKKENWIGRNYYKQLDDEAIERMDRAANERIGAAPFLSPPPTPMKREALDILSPASKMQAVEVAKLLERKPLFADEL